MLVNDQYKHFEVKYSDAIKVTFGNFHFLPYDCKCAKLSPISE